MESARNIPSQDNAQIIQKKFVPDRRPTHKESMTCADKVWINVTQHHEALQLLKDAKT